MSDILADYREWRDAQPTRIGTHSDRCHLWERHEKCMIHRLARKLEAVTLTDAEREAVEYVCKNVLPDGSREGDDALQTLRGLLKRTGGKG